MKTTQLKTLQGTEREDRKKAAVAGSLRKIPTMPTLPSNSPVGNKLTRKIYKEIYQFLIDNEMAEGIDKWAVAQAAGACYLARYYMNEVLMGNGIQQFSTGERQISPEAAMAKHWDGVFRGYCSVFGMTHKDREKMLIFAVEEGDTTDAMLAFLTPKNRNKVTTG